MRRTGFPTFTLLIALLLSTAHAVDGQRRNLRFHRLSLAEGLSQTFVYAAVQDHRGFMWFGTQEGLNRYDGYDFVVRRHDPNDPTSLSHDFVKTILEDSERRLWVGTEGGGLNLYDPALDHFVHYRHDPADPQSLSNDRVQSLHEGPRGSIWVGTDGGGLNLLDPVTGRVTRFSVLAPGADPGTPVEAMTASGDGRLWVGTNGAGLYLLDPETGDTVSYRHRPNDPRSLSHDAIRALLRDRNGRLWIATSHGLNVFDPGSELFERHLHDSRSSDSLSHSSVKALLQDASGTIWIGTDSGLNEWRPQSRSFHRYHHDYGDAFSLSSDNVISLYEDRGGVLWVGTMKGLNRWNSRTTTFHHIKPDAGDPEALHGDFVVALAERKDGKVWVGTFGGGLNLFDPVNETFEHFRHDPRDPSTLSDDRVMALHVDRANVLWVGTRSGGLNRLEPGAREFTRYVHEPENENSLSSNGVTSILEDRRGRLWIATHGGGLNRLHRATGRFEAYRHDPEVPERSLSGDRVLTVHEDSSGALWLGTEGAGINRLDPDTGEIRSYRNQPDRLESLSSDQIFDVLEGPRGDLWMATVGGLNRWTAADRAAGVERFQRFTARDGLPSTTTYALLFDPRDQLWISTNHGLARLDPETGAIRNYDVSHGLQSDEFNFGPRLATRDGLLYFGGVNGFNYFDPVAMSENQRIPPVVLTSVLVSNKPLTTDRPLQELTEVQLGHRDHVISFEFAALDFASPEHNLYRHRLEGFDREWLEAGKQRRVTYTNLEPGEYTFRVRASNNDGYWNQDGVSIKVRAMAPPWRRGWAYALYAAVAGSLLLFYVMGQIKKRERARELAEANEALTEEIAARRAKERALQAEKERARRYLEVAEVIMVVVDEGGRVSLVNQKGRRVLGYSEDEILGHDWCRQFVPDDERDEFQRHLADREDSGSFESSVVTRDGQRRIIVWQTTHLPADEGHGASGTLCSGTDITEMRWLAEAKDAAESASRSKSQFLANMSHEIRTPMGGVLGMIELLLSTRLTERQRGFADTARRSARNLLDILNDILDFSKIEAGKLELEKTDFSPRRLANEIIDLFSERAHQKQLELGIWLDEKLPLALRGDPTRLRQILSNLIGNAIKFTERGFVELRVAVEKVEGGHHRLRFEVRDSGPGVKKEARRRIFESFHQADGSTTRKYGGSGLGLAISRQLVEMMGGEIGVDSETGLGSTFWFTVPLQASTESSLLRSQGLELESLRVLLVSDHRGDATRVRQLLDGWGVRPTIVADVATAADLFERKQPAAERFQVVLAEERLGGLELARSLAVRPAERRAPVAVIADGETDLESPGVLKQLPAPVRASDLFELLTGLLTASDGLAPAGSGSLNPAHGTRILLAEDNPVFQEVVSSMVANLGGAVTVVDNGKDAVESALADDYDLVLMDCQMPTMDGYQATRTLRQRLARGADASSRRLPIVAMTANAMAGDREQCLEVGMDDYISKPFTQDSLRAVLERWLTQRSCEETDDRQLAQREKGRSIEHAESADAQSAEGVHGKLVYLPAPMSSPPGEVDGDENREANGANARPGEPGSTATRAVTPAALDRRALDSLRAVDTNGTDIAQRVLERFSETAGKHVERMQMALEKEDPKLLGLGAHTLKSSSAMIGASRLAELCRKIEEGARKGAVFGVEDEIDAVAVELERVQLALALERERVTTPDLAARGGIR